MAAIIMPQAFAIAGRLADRPAPVNVAAFASLSTMIGFIRPPLFGGLAETVGLRYAYSLVPPLTLLPDGRHMGAKSA